MYSPSGSFGVIPADAGEFDDLAPEESLHVLDEPVEIVSVSEIKGPESQIVLALCIHLLPPREVILAGAGVYPVLGLLGDHLARCVIQEAVFIDYRMMV